MLMVNKLETNVKKCLAYERGQLLTHVKENDLVHGQWIKWVESIGLSRQTAHEYMKIFKAGLDLLKYEERGMSFRQLYELTFLTIEERADSYLMEDGSYKTVDEMTVRELKALKERLSMVEEELQKEKRKVKQEQELRKACTERKENSFADILVNALKAFNVHDAILQHVYTDNNGHVYRIDLYIPSLNVAIEYNEKNHIGYTVEAFEVREDNIRKSLGCEVVNVLDAHENGYNVGFVIKMMLQYGLLKY